MSRIFTKFRNNPKKTIFFSGLLYFGYSYGQERYRAFTMMRKLAEEAQGWSNKPLPTGARNKHITLILNPVSRNRKGKTMFEKFGEPLIHLSGFLVNIVKTEKISEARDLVELIDKTNIIAVVGGDGSLMEVITGLLRREDADEACRRYPIAVIPGGIHNTFANKLFESDHGQANVKDVIAEAAMSIGRYCIVPQDVVEVSRVEPKEETSDTSLQINSDEDGYILPTQDMGLEIIKAEVNPSPEKPGEPETPLEPSSKPYFSMSGLQLGLFREADKIEANLPLMFNRKFCALYSFLRAKSPMVKAEIRYVPYCSGCLKCKVVVPASNVSLMTRIVSAFRAPAPAEAPVDNDPKWSVENPECGKWESFCVESPELNVLPKGDGKLEIQVGSHLNLTDFVREGFRRRFEKKFEFSQTVLCREVEIIPISSPDFCSIDNDEFPVVPLRMKVLPKKVHFFAQRKEG